MSEYEDGAIAAHHVMSELAVMSKMFRSGFASMATEISARALFALSDDTKSVDGDPDDWWYGRDEASIMADNLVQHSPVWKAGWSSVLKAPAEARARAEDFESRVARHVAEMKAINALVEHKLAPTVVPKPRTDALDRLELARIEKLREAREIKSRADRIVQAARGAPEFVVLNGGVPIAADPVAIRSFVRQTRQEIGQAKAVPELEYRNAYGVPE